MFSREKVSDYHKYGINSFFLINIKIFRVQYTDRRETLRQFDKPEVQPDIQYAIEP